MGETEEFNTLAFEKKLSQLKDTQESIQSLSSWCLKQRSHHKKIVSSWLNVLKRVKVEQRLVLFYLANDVIQYSKRKNYEFVDCWGLNLQKATPLVRDEKVRPKILRIFKIWEQRSVYDDEFLSDLTGLLSAGAVKKADDDALDFQPQQLVNKIKQCSVLEADTDLRLKNIHDSQLQLSDADALCASLKDRTNKDDIEKDLNEGVAFVERYTEALQREIVARESLLALLSSANVYYSTQRGEVKVVAYAYKNFGARVRALKRKLDELIPTLPKAAPSPPQHDEDVPSPGPDEDLELPNTSDITDDDVSYNIDKTFSTSLTADGSLYNRGLSSFLSSDNTLAIFNENNQEVTSANKIEVISSRSTENQDFNINDFLKTLMPNESTVSSDNNSVTSATISQKSQDALPGLDLLTPESTGNPPPPTSFYGSMDATINDDVDQPYLPETDSPWNISNWNMPDLPAVDVDHRGALPPPPPPPALPILSALGNLEDVDHRLLPTLTPPLPTSTPVSRHSIGHKDVDHRNLISLTNQLSIPNQMNSASVDQDYRVPVMVPPPDIVESVDMDLSEDEEQHAYQITQNPKDNQRRHNFNNNNKVLVGGDNSTHNNLIRINSTPERIYDVDEPPPPVSVSAPINTPFNMPSALKQYSMPEQNFLQNLLTPDEKPPENLFEEDTRERSIPITRNPSPPEYEYNNESDWQNVGPRPFTNQRFPRNWAPRTNFRPQSFGPQQYWPRNGPRPPNRWMGPRPQRFW